MKYRFVKSLTLLGYMSTGSLLLQADDISLHGYGTAGIAYQANDDVLYRNSFNMDSGTQGDISFANYSSLGLQLDVKVNDKLSLTAQGVASKTNPNAKLVELSWLNSKYEISDSFSIRAGLMRLPAFMYSDILDVDYSYDWIRLPDMYSMMPINNYRGVEFNKNIRFDNFSLNSVLLFGNSRTTTYNSIADGTIDQSKLEIDNIFGTSLSFLSDDLTFRVSYCKLKSTLKNKRLDGFLSQIGLIGIGSIDQAINRYKLKKSTADYLELGGKYTFDDAYIVGEYIKITTEKFVANNSSWYVGAGYNFENWSPFVIYSAIISNQKNKDIPIAEGTPPNLVAVITGVNQALNAISNNVATVELETVSLGLRYDLSENSILKLQYDRQKEFKKNRLNFHFSDKEKVDLNIYSVAISFIF